MLGLLLLGSPSARLEVWLTCHRTQVIDPLDVEAQMMERAETRRAELHVWIEASGQTLCDQEVRIVPAPQP